MLSLAQPSTCASSTRLPQGSARNASPWLMTASSTSPGLTTIEWPVLLTDFSVREGVVRFLHDSAGFVGCCLALCRGHHRRRGHAKGRQHSSTRVNFSRTFPCAAPLVSSILSSVFHWTKSTDFTPFAARSLGVAFSEGS